MGYYWVRTLLVLREMPNSCGDLMAVHIPFHRGRFGHSPTAPQMQPIPDKLENAKLSSEYPDRSYVIKYY